MFEPSTAHILAVDDEPANLRVLDKMLQRYGYEHFYSTADPRQTLDMIREHQIDLVLLDLNMPHLDGYQVLKQIKDELPVDDAPTVLMVTAQHAQEARQKALDSGALDYVTKPFNISELTSRVRNLLEVRMAHKLVRNQNEILEQKVRERTEELHETRLQVVRCLGRAAEYRDNETGLHIVRMSMIAALLGKAVGMNDYDCDLLLNAAPMHDIGKIGIPDSILLKPGKLTPEEFDRMKQHVPIGADILSGSDTDLLNMAREITMTHHEKWDGSGYPNGLAGEDIPIVGRICALADVFDALTSKRPYKHAWPVDEAVDFIKDQSGSHFDPALVGHLIKLLPEILEIKEKYAEPTN